MKYLKSINEKKSPFRIYMLLVHLSAFTQQPQLQRSALSYILHPTSKIPFPKIPYFCIMIIIDKTLVSEDLKQECFACDLSKCKGECCVQGDAGAPLEEEEIGIIEDFIDEIKPYMEEKGRLVVEEQGVFDYDSDGSYVTPLVNDRECAFVYFEDGIAWCAIEKAWKEGKISYQKPISCHLYPVRLSQLSAYEAVNYHKWEICKPAREKGKKENATLYKFLEGPLKRKYGEEWYKKLANGEKI